MQNFSMTLKPGILILMLFILFQLTYTFGQAGSDFISKSELKFEANKNQWNSNVLFKTNLKGGRLFLENDKFTFVYYKLSDLEKAHNQPSKDNNENIINCHAYTMSFLGAEKNVIVSGSGEQDAYYNYFIGNDSARWASNVALFRHVN